MFYYFIALCLRGALPATMPTSAAAPHRFHAMAHFLLVFVSISVVDGTCNISFNLILYSLLWFFLIKFTAYFAAGADAEWESRGRGEGCLNETLVLLNMIIDFAVPHSLSSSFPSSLSTLTCAFNFFPNSFSIRFRLHHTIFSSFHTFSAAVPLPPLLPLYPPSSSLLLLVVVMFVVVVTSGTSKRQKTTTLIAAKSANAIGKCICICRCSCICICSQWSYLCLVSFVSISRCELVIQPPPPPTCSRYRFVPLQRAQYFIWFRAVLFFRLLFIELCLLPDSSGGPRTLQRQGRTAASCGRDGAVRASLKHIETCVFQSTAAACGLFVLRCAMIWFICTQLYDIYMSWQPRRTAANRTQLNWTEPERSGCCSWS